MRQVLARAELEKEEAVEKAHKAALRQARHWEGETLQQARTENSNEHIRLEGIPLGKSQAEMALAAELAQREKLQASELAEADEARLLEKAEQEALEPAEADKAAILEQARREALEDIERAEAVQALAVEKAVGEARKEAVQALAVEKA